MKYYLCKAGRKMFNGDEFAEPGDYITKYQKVAENLKCRWLVWNGRVYYHTKGGVWEDCGLTLSDFGINS